jgi:hypothetical protein
MPNGDNRDPMKPYRDASRSKAAIEAVKAYRKYQKLLGEGWPADKAFQVAFLGVMLLFMPELKPLPRPDPPFEIASLHKALTSAHADITRLLKDVENDLAYLKDKIPG